MSSTTKKQFSASAYVKKAVHEYRDAPAHRGAEGQKLRVISVEAGSVAGRIGLKPGDEIQELNGKPLLDVIDFQFNAANVGRRTTIRTQDRKITFVRREWEPFGLEFEAIEPMTCKNQCVFCFVHQNPKNVRKSLHIKDEDYRLSFLFGNYLTLTNVSEEEMQRIIEQRLSPLYVSVHATEPELRRTLLGIEEYDGFMAKVERLAGAGIQMHGQVVLCPGLNDGAHLERTIDDFRRFHPMTSSMAIVPVGLTDHRKNLPLLQSFTPQYARQLIAHVGNIQKKLKREMGTPFAYLGDEIYIMAGAKIPPASHYAEFPQMENGVGMVRTFLGQWAKAMRSWKRRSARGTVCTGKVFYPYLKECVDKLGADLLVVGVESKFWGQGIGVAGLLTGSDFIQALKGRVYGDFVVIPSECMAGDEYLFLDDLTIKDVERELGVEVVPSGYDARDFVAWLGGKAARAARV